MDTAEHPLKKRKLYDLVPEPSSPPQPPPTVPLQTPHPPPLQLNRNSSAVSPPSQDEILKRRSNREEIRSLYECYKRIKICVSRKDALITPDLEQAYLSLITASRGCTSVQRILADLIPRYASYCPTALEAAAKVTINMHNWSLAVINRGEDADEVALETAKACIFGLVDICHAASSVAETSTVIQGICSEVFIDVLIFLLSSFEGRDIFQIVDLETLKIQGSIEFFSNLKQKFSNEEESALTKLSKLRALCFLRIFFCNPRNSLGACFELFDTTTQEGADKGLFFLSLVSGRFAADHVSHNLKAGCETNLSTATLETDVEGSDSFSEGQSSGGYIFVKEASHVARDCLLGLVLVKDPSLGSWICSKYEKLCKLSSSGIVSQVTSVLEGIIKLFTDLVKLEDGRVSSERDDSDPSKGRNGQNSAPGLTVHKVSPDISGRDCTSRVQDGYDNEKLIDAFSGQHLKRHSLLVAPETDILNASPSYDSGGSKSANIDSGDHEEYPRHRSSTPKDLLNNQIASPVSRKPLDFRISLPERRSLNLIEQNQARNSDHSLSGLQFSPGAVNIASGSPGHHHLAVQPPCMRYEVHQYSDGDPAAMDIFSASNQLWVGPLGPDASEAVIRFQFEKFGPLEQFSHFPYKDFALVEYKYLMDAIRARRIMRGQSPWGACLCIKFLDRGSGSKGISNNIAIGSSCQVYIGNIVSRWAKDEILQDLIKVFHKGPRMVTDLTSEGALLLEFDTPEEASDVMTLLGQRRKESSHSPLSHVPAANANVNRSMDVLLDTGSFCDEFRRNDFANSVASTPAHTVVETRTSRLAALLSSLREKYNLIHGLGHIDHHISANNTREEDQLPTSTLWIKLLSTNSAVPTDDEIKVICDLCIGSAGSVIRLTQANMHMNSGWFVECSSVDAAKALFRNLQACPLSFFQIEFSRSGAAACTSHQENYGTAQQSGPTHPSSSFTCSSAGTPEIGMRRTDGYDNATLATPSNGGSLVISGATEQTWIHKQPEHELHPAPGNVPCLPSHAHGTMLPPPQPFQMTPFMQPVYFTPNSSWDARSYSHHHHSFFVPNIPHSNSVAAPFIPASVTPLPQMVGSSLQNSSQTYPSLVVPAPIAPPLPPPPPPPPPSGMPPPAQPLPPQSEMPPPLPPPIPSLSQPPLNPPPLNPPPPPSSPPPPPPPPSPPPRAPVLAQSCHVERSALHAQYQWQGALSKSGAHYCTIYAHRVVSESCTYSSAVSEPTEWPVKLDMTKRTDFRHVKSTFSSTPPHRREVCWLFPSSEGDRKGFQDFVMYLKQRECAGVIKIPASKSMSTRLLFILPSSAEACSLLSIAPNPLECLIALVLPKETGLEWA